VFLHRRSFIQAVEGAGLENPQAEGKPVVYVFHGDDPFTIRQTVEAIMKQVGEDLAIAEMNITRLDGRSASEEDIRSAANSMPFLAERRLVILTNPFARLGTDATRKRFLALLDGLPPTTALVLIVEDTLDRGKWKSLPQMESNWLRRWLSAAGERALYKLYPLPRMNEMPEWVRKEAKRQGGQFSQEGAMALAAHVGNDTQLASVEITKLLTYVDSRRPVGAEDVQDLTAQTGQADVFDMVDALAGGNTRQALSLLHRLLEVQDPLSLFGMITRQFRLLLQAREVIDEGRGAQIASELHIHPFVAEKLSTQARRFNLAQLKEIYHRLLLLDESMKTSQAPADLALDTFIAEMG
jgi:DNA polymerase-3 subunit delta